jgi:hypothetical protein
VKRSLLLRRAYAWDGCPPHRRIELPAEENSRRKKRAATGSRENKIVVTTQALRLSPAAEELDDVRNQVHVSPLTVL